MRLFVAADISSSTRAQVRSVREQLVPLLSGNHPPRVTWVKDEAAHVTLRFIGEISDDLASAVVAALTPPLDLRPFAVRWDQLGTFPGGRAPRVIWIGTSRGAELLAALAHLVATRVEPVIGPGETRAFKSHVTVGRVKVPGRNFDWREVLTRVRFDPTTTRVDHVTLYRSQLSPKGPTYIEIARTILR